MVNKRMFELHEDLEIPISNALYVVDTRIRSFLDFLIPCSIWLDWGLETKKVKQSPLPIA